jgi:hypothetical protein
MLAYRPTDLDYIMRYAARSIGPKGAPSMIFAMANRDVLIVKLPLVLASLVMTDQEKDLDRSFVVGVQSERDLQLCQRLHSTCWLDDLQTVPFEPVPNEGRSASHRQSHLVASLAWRKLEVAR